MHASRLYLYSTGRLVADWPDDEAIAQHSLTASFASDVRGCHDRDSIFDWKIAVKIEALEPAAIEDEGNPHRDKDVFRYGLAPLGAPGRNRTSTPCGTRF
jgi:hypothetical protein